MAENNEGQNLLSGLVALDCGQGMAPAIISKFLIESGVKLLRVVPEGDEAFSKIYPAYDYWRQPGECVDTPQTDEEWRTLLRSVDILISGGEDHPDVTPVRPAVDSLGHDALISLHIGRGPFEDEDQNLFPMTEMLAQAGSGIAFEQYPHKPVAMSFAPASYGAAFQGMIGLIAALIARESSGLGQSVRTSLLEGAWSWLPMFWCDFEKPDPAASFVTPKDAVPLIFQCADGKFLHFVLGSAGSKYRLYQVLGIDDPDIKPNDNGMPKPGAGPRHFYGDIDLLAAYCKKWERDALLEALWKAGLPAEPVLPPGALWDDPQIQRNGVIKTFSDGARGVGLPYLAHIRNAEKARKVGGGDKPLDGIRVLDFGAYVAGPLASQLLTGLGAEVIKVEPMAGDPSRGLLRGFLSGNRGKKGVTLDLKSPEGIEKARNLIASSHIVSSNFRSGVSAKLGIDPDNLFELQPDLLVLESPAYGSEGPKAQQAGFDMVMQAATGLEYRAGISQDMPVWNRLSMVDFAAGNLGGIAILSSLYHRIKHGNGVLIEAPLVNAGLFLLSELVQTPEKDFIGAPPAIGEETGLLETERLFQTLDGWIAVSIRGREACSRYSDEQTGALVEAMNTEEALSYLWKQGFWAAKCLSDVEGAVLNDPRQVERGLVRLTQHKRFGRARDLGHFFTMSRSATGSDQPMFELGEHNDEFFN
ncbi:MAG: hypothetical protein CME88_02110 [Hirschia sp.]|nr:hypothetical protein [Hirschia sp.]MBF17157.1 hypothetical protein [Hirschia sp.]